MQLFNKAALKRHLLERIQIVNPINGPKFTRVSSEALVDLDVRFRKLVDEYLRCQRIGKTISTP